MKTIILTILFSLTTLTAFAGTTYIDTHNHINGKFGQRANKAPDFDGAAQVALKKMDKLGIQKMIVMPPPFTPDNQMKYRSEEFASAVQKYPDRFAYLGGGGSLNPMILKAIEMGKTPPQLKQKFRQRANQIIKNGAAGFGELSAEHLSLGPKHHHQSAPPDHPLFLVLADIAAQNNVPIDLHMEAVPKRMRVSSHVKGTNNPSHIEANIDAFERLLSHNPRAKIIWDHVGWDNTGYRTTQLIDKMMAKHPNLYMSFKISLNDSKAENVPIEKGVGLKEDWIALIKKYPDRFIIGADQFYLSPQMKGRIGQPSVDSTNRFFNQLPPDLAKKVGTENALKLFNITN